MEPGPGYRGMRLLRRLTRLHYERSDEGIYITAAQQENAPTGGVLATDVASFPTYESMLRLHPLERRRLAVS